MIKENSTTGTRTRVARVRAEYPNQLDYGGSAQQCVTSKQASQKMRTVLEPGGKHSWDRVASSPGTGQRAVLGPSGKQSWDRGAMSGLTPHPPNNLLQTVSSLPTSINSMQHHCDTWVRQMPNKRSALCPFVTLEKQAQ